MKLTRGAMVMKEETATAKPQLAGWWSRTVSLRTHWVPTDVNIIEMAARIRSLRSAMDESEFKPSRNAQP